MLIHTLKTSIIIFFASITSLTFATSYYVSSAGTSSANGTIVSPFDFTTAIGKPLLAGDSLIFRGGSYSFTSPQSFSKSGSAVNPIYYVAFQSEIPVFDFRTQSYGSSSRGLNLSGNYMHIKGIIVQGAGDNGFYVEGSNLLIEQCTSRWNCDSGFQLKNGSNNYILNCDSYENFDYESKNSDATPNYGGNADGFADKQYTNNGTNTYKGCRSWRNGDDGWDSYQKVGNTVYDSCWCYSMAPATFDMKQNIRFKTDSASWFYQFTSTNFVMTNYGNGNGFKLGGLTTVNNTSLHNCISVGNKVKGFDQNNNAGLMTIYNCTSYNNGSNYGFSNSSVGTLIIKNCASLNSISSNSFSSKLVTQSNNSWNTGFTCIASDFVSLDYTQMLNARRADGSLPEIPLLHLTSTSGLIDKGTDVGLSFYGTGPDLGAYEFNPNLTATPIIKDSSSDISIYYSSPNHDISIKGRISYVEIYQITGQEIYKRHISTDNLEIQTNNLSKGIFLIRLISQNGTSTSKKILID